MRNFVIIYILNGCDYMKAILVGISTNYDRYDLDYSLDELKNLDAVYSADSFRAIGTAKYVAEINNLNDNEIRETLMLSGPESSDAIARAKNLDFEDLLSDIEGIVNSGTKLDISYYLDKHMDEDKVEDIYLYFKEDAESDSLDAAIEELGSDYSEEEIRLVRIKFLCEVGN